MKSLGSSLLVAVAWSAPLVAQEAPVRVLSLAEAAQRALLQNDRLLGSRDAVEQADLSVRLAKATFRPKVVPNVFGSLGQTDISNQTYRLDLSQRFVTGTELRATTGTTSAKNQIGTYYNADTTLQLSQPLLRGFGKSVARRNLTAAEARRADVERQQGLSEQQIVLEVAGTYYRIVAQKRLVASAEKSLERARNLLEASSAKLGVGRVSQLDVFRAQQLLAQAEGQLLDARTAVEDAKDQLRGLLAEGADFQFEVGDEIPKAIEPISADQAVGIALERRLELRGAEEAIAESERTAAFAKNQLRPQLDLNLTLTRREAVPTFGSSFGFDNFRLATFFAVSMPMDRTAQTVELHNALIERDRRRREVQTLRMRIAEQARRAVRQQERLLRGLEVADQSVQFAEKELEVANLRYQRGLSNNLDVVSAEGNVLAAEGRRVGILAELAVARLTLRATLGTLDPRTDVGAEG
jgi:outer membrane protein TolC